MSVEISYGDLDVSLSASGRYSPDVMDDLAKRAAEAFATSLLVQRQTASGESTQA